jgi:hypothetical protein
LFLEKEMNGLKTVIMTLSAVTLITGQAQALVDFEDVGASLPAESHWMAPTPSELYTPVEETFTSNNTEFVQTVTNWDTMVSWSGFTYSNETDITTEGYTNDTSAYAGTPGNTYSVCYVDSYAGAQEIVFDIESTISGMWVTNTTYAYYSMLNGDGFAKKFGGEIGTDPDWFKLSITGTGSSGSETVDFMLADFTSENSSEDYIIDNWTWVDLSELGDVSTLSFALSSTDNNDFGMKTPAYFAFDNLNGSADSAPVPEPAALTLLGLGIAALLKRNR